MAEVNWSNEAKSNLIAIAEYFDASSEEYSFYLVESIYDCISELIKHPKIGRTVPEFGLEMFRERLVEGYRVIYFLQGDSVEILAIVHSRQDLVKHLKRE